MIKDMVSIIMPIYNVEKFLLESVKSAVMQTYKNIEIILVDDGSPDGSGKMCDEFEKKYNKVKVVHKVNGGLSDARNAGIEVAQGEYLYFFDSDDCIHPQMIEILVNEFKKDPECDFVECGYKDIQEDEKPAYLPIKDYSTFSVDFYTFCKNVMINWNVNVPMVWTKLYKAETFKEIRFEKGKIHEDEFLFTRLAPTLNRVRVINQPMYYYRQRGNSIMTQPYSLKRVVVYDAFVERYRIYQNRDKNLAENQIIYIVNMLFAAIAQVRNGNSADEDKVIEEITTRITPILEDIYASPYVSTYCKKGIKLMIKDVASFKETYKFNSWQWLMVHFDK